MQNNSKCSCIQKQCFSFNYNFIIVIPKQKEHLHLTFFSKVTVANIFKKMLASTTLVISHVCDIIVLTSGMYPVMNLLSLFLSIKSLKITYFFDCNKNVEFYTILIRRLIIFSTQSLFSVQYLFSASASTRNQFGLSLTVFEISDIRKYFVKYSFFLHKFISRQLFILPKIFVPTKVLHTACTPTEPKQNLLL